MLVINIQLFAQEINEYSLNIIYCKNEGFLEVIMKNQTQKNIKIENPNLFSRNFFGQSKYWNLKIMDENNNIIHCYPLSYYNHVIPNEKNGYQLLKRIIQ